MKLVYEASRWFCCPKKFVINGVEADRYDFGTQDDADPDNAPHYGCGDMQFTRQPSTLEVLAKYGISQEEYDAICGKLEADLSFGCCALCE